MWNGLVADDKPSVLTPVGVTFLLQRQLVGLVNAQSKVPEHVRITLKPLQRTDRKPVFPGSATNGVAFPGLRAGFQATPVAPIPNRIMTGNRITGQANYAHIKWGIGGAKQQEMLADWPQTGGSIDVVADNVVVEGVCGETPGLAVPAADVGAEPRFAAEIGPCGGMARSEYDGLSFGQVLNGLFQTGTQFQVGVPEFAKAVQLGLADALAATGVIEVAWSDANTQLIFVSRYGLSSAANGNLIMPLRIAVPLGAVFCTVFAVALATVVTTATLEWRLAP